MVNNPDLTPELWDQCLDCFKTFNALILQYQGVFVTSNNWDGVMGLIQSLDRSAQAILSFGGLNNAPRLTSKFFTTLASPLNLQLNQTVLACEEKLAKRGSDEK